ncbi:MAG: NAD-dependent epimerase/dehydratase family protein [Nanoarchaeota archaeon]
MDEQIVFGKGFLGTRISSSLGYEIVDREIVDPTNIKDLASFLDETKPSVVINAIGKTGKPNIDWCEKHKEETLQSNVSAAINLSTECALRRIYFVHLGSGCMYQGDNDGKDFTRAIFITGIASFLAVSIIIFVRYKKIKTSLALLLTSFSEVIIILGIAALIKWNIDLPGIAGILATIGTGVDQQIVVIDEAKHGKVLSLKEKMKRAFAIILGSYFTVFVSLLPLLWAGAGLLKGFAVTTLIGITAGVLITRPAFTDLIRKIEE